MTQSPASQMRQEVHRVGAAAQFRVLSAQGHAAAQSKTHKLSDKNVKDDRAKRLP